MTKMAELHYDGKKISLPIVEGTEGERAIDIRKLRDETGLITLDPGYGNTGSCESAITFIDGEKGILRYRGYPIEELAAKSSFLEVALPADLRRAADARRSSTPSRTRSAYHTMLHEDFRRFYRVAAEGRAPDGGVLGGGRRARDVLPRFARSALDAPGRDLRPPPDREAADDRGLRATSTRSASRSCIPTTSCRYVGNFLQLMFATPCEPYEVDPVVEKAIDLLLILHADHEQNCSTSTVRLVGSSHANLFAAVSAGINALWGPRHGGANQEVIEMLQQIDGEGMTAKRVRRARQEPGRHLAPDGLRPPRLQELRPAREDHQEGVLRRARSARRAQQAARDRGRARGARAEGRLLRRAQASTRTSISTRA